MSHPGKEELLRLETALYSRGFEKIAGIDEAGRGPLAGPVVSACVVFHPGFFIEGVRDSKTVSEKNRERLFGEICENCLAYGIGIVDNKTIDRINIYEAARLSMLLAIDQIDVEPDFILIDAMPLELEIPNQSVIKGDSKSFSIAAASILAKVTRDGIMRNYHQEYPNYGWDRNKGYPTQEHRSAVKQFGFTPYHRRSFSVR